MLRRDQEPQIKLQIVAAFILFGIAVPMKLSSQALPAESVNIVGSARSKYYSLAGSGFMSATCLVDFDYTTVPSLLSGDQQAQSKLLKATKFTIKLDVRNGAAVKTIFPSGTSVSDQQSLATSTNLLASLVTGLFQTWASKGLQGPIPPFDSEIESASGTENGYRITLRVPGGPAHIDLDRNYLVTEIVSVGGKLVEKPTFAPSPDGLVFVGNAATDDSDPAAPVKVRYEIENAPVDGLRLPSSVHLRVNQGVNVTFTLNGCSLVRGTVIKVGPPPKAQ